MDCHKPQVCEAGLDHGIVLLVDVEPQQEIIDFGLQQMCWQRFVVNFLSLLWAGDHLHRSLCIVAPSADADFPEPAVAGWKHRRMPAE